MGVPELVKEEIRDRIDLVALVSETVKLKRSGASYVGLCPFHREKSPSFSVVPAKKLFYCFGCHEGGDAFKFVMKRDNITFPQALEKLASIAGVELSRYESGPGTGKIKRLLEANDAARAFFVEKLGESEAARRYLTGRGLTPRTLSDFSVGYAPDAWQSLTDHMAGRGFTLDELVEAGLAKRRENRDGVYDVFRNRIVFPIHDEQGRVIAFGGRTLGDEQPKYLNTPETPLYSKGRHLFNYHRVLSRGGSPGEVLLVEGYMDVIGLVQGGVSGVVATLGTALTQHHVRKLGRVARTLVLAYDPDPAGVRATLRSFELLEGVDMAIRVLTLPDGQDPDEMILAEGLEAWSLRVRGAREVEDYLVDRVLAKVDLKDEKQRREAYRECQAFYDILPTAPGRDAFMRLVADRFSLAEELVRDSFLRKRKKAASPDLAPRVAEELPADVRWERFLLMAFLSEIDLYRDLAPELAADDFRDPVSMRLLAHVRAIALEDGEGSILNRLADGAGDEDLARMIARESNSTSNILPESDREGALRDCLKTLRRLRLTQERNRLAQKLKGNLDESEKRETQREFQRIVSVIAGLGPGGNLAALGERHMDDTSMGRRES